VILLTGATGFLGMELLVRLLERDDREVVALIRASDDAAATARLQGVLATLFAPGDQPAPGRVRAVAADLEAPGLGLTGEAAAGLAEQVETVVHCAASVSFALPLEEARRINVEGTRGVLELAARAPGLKQVVHVSTAYVAGQRDGRAFEHEGDVGQEPRNTYEQTKLEAEALVLASGLPVAILRPSIVVGDSRTGWTPAFNVIYWPLQGFARGLLTSVAADPDGRVDVVPVDAVADALLELSRREGQTGTFHVVAGDGAPTCGRLSAMAASAFGKASPPFVPLGHDLEAEATASVFLPYFRVKTIFDPGAGAGLAAPVPSLEAYFPELMDYARQARWGKTPLPRWKRHPEATRAAAA
jgi:thioester reductase-like protein